MFLKHCFQIQKLKKNIISPLVLCCVFSKFDLLVTTSNLRWFRLDNCQQKSASQNFNFLNLLIYQIYFVKVQCIALSQTLTNQHSQIFYKSKGMISWHFLSRLFYVFEYYCDENEEIAEFRFKIFVVFS